MRDLRALLVNRTRGVVVLHTVVVYGHSKYGPMAATNFGLLPKLGQCPWQVIRRLSRSLPIQLACGYFHPLTTGHFWQPDCEYEVRSSNCPRRVGHARTTDEHTD
jgi:hypothetical protein